MRKLVTILLLLFMVAVKGKDNDPKPLTGKVEYNSYRSDNGKLYINFHDFPYDQSIILRAVTFGNGKIEIDLTDAGNLSYAVKDELEKQKGVYVIENGYHIPDSNSAVEENATSTEE